MESTQLVAIPIAVQFRVAFWSLWMFAYIICHLVLSVEIVHLLTNLYEVWTSRSFNLLSN